MITQFQMFWLWIVAVIQVCITIVFILAYLLQCDMSWWRGRDKEEKREQPKTIKQFWDIYIYDRIKGKEISKRRFWITVSIMFCMLIATITVPIITYKVGTGEIAPHEKMPDMYITNITTFRMFNPLYQQTNITIHNRGDVKATEITIQISFTENVTIKDCENIYNLSYLKGVLIGGGKKSYYSTYRFDELDINYAIPIRIVSTHPDFNLTNTFTIDPLPIYMSNKEQGPIYG